MSFLKDVIYIDKHYFGFDDSKQITYDLVRIKGDIYQTSWHMHHHLEYEHKLGRTIYLFKNKDSRDGKWTHYTGMNDPDSLGIQIWEYRAVCL